MAARKRFNVDISLLLLLAVITLTGCGSHAPAPITSRTPPPADKINHHIISAGETLYSIAWRYGLDHRKLAVANGIPAPYTIFVGQRLTLDLSKSPSSVAVAPKPSANKPVSRERKAPANKPKVTPKPPVATKLPSKPKPQTASRPAATNKAPSKPVALPKSWKWHWPVKGKVVRHYDVNKRFKGIHIHAQRGTAVKAAGPGVVVYAGNGLHSYGRSIIIKHSDVYLSFYALNRRLLVKEGERVAAGQKIAEVGGDINEPNRIYFEIRRDGNSTDPIRLLPKP